MAGETVEREQANPVVHGVKGVGGVTRKKILLEASNRAQSVGVKEDQQVLGEFAGLGEVNLPETPGDAFQARRAEAGAGQDNTEGIDVAAVRHAPQQRGFQHAGAAAHERVIDDLARLCEALDEEAGQLGLKAGAVGNLVQ